MFSASTESSRPAKSIKSSFSPSSRLEGTSRVSETIFEETQGGAIGNKGTPGGVSPLVRPISYPVVEGSQEFFADEVAFSASDVHLERPSSPPPLLTETIPFRPNGVTPPDRARRMAPEACGLVFAGPMGNLPMANIPISPNLKESKPWSIEMMMREAIRHYHSSSPVDIQSAAHLLGKLHTLFLNCEPILPYEEREYIFKAYNENLLRQSLYIEAAELRLLCAPSYPAVYEYAQIESFINVFCFVCKRAYDNPWRDNRRCHRCNTPQPPCSICMSIDPPPEWVDEQKIMEEGCAARREEFQAEEPFLSPSSSRTELVTSSELQRLGFSYDDSCSLSRPQGAALWTWCQGCGHGGHLACMAKWLGDITYSEGGCATAGCNHDCAPGPRREANRAARLDESKRRESSTRRSGVGYVKRDPWTMGESKAVEKVRGMLHNASGGGGSSTSTTASTTNTTATFNSTPLINTGAGYGGAPLSSGVMSPKKVRLVTPSEQDRRLRVGSSSARDRETQSDGQTGA